MKRTRYTRKYVIHLPRIAIREPGIYEITIKNPVMVIEKIAELRDARDVNFTGEIERGSIDSDESTDTDDSGRT